MLDAGDWRLLTGDGVVRIRIPLPHRVTDGVPKLSWTCGLPCRQCCTAQHLLS